MIKKGEKFSRTKKNQGKYKWNKAEAAIINIRQSGIQGQKALTKSEKNINKVKNYNSFRRYKIHRLKL